MARRSGPGPVRRPLTLRRASRRRSRNCWPRMPPRGGRPSGALLECLSRRHRAGGGSGSKATRQSKVASLRTCRSGAAESPQIWVVCDHKCPDGPVVARFGSFVITSVQTAWWRHRFGSFVITSDETAVGCVCRSRCCWEMAPPLVLEPQRHSDAPLAQRFTYPFERALRLVVDSARGDDEQSVVHPIQVLTPV